MEPTILFEDTDIVVVDKPAGMIVHPATDAGLASRDSLVDWFIRHDSRVASHDWLDRSRIGIVHRLDRDTSGAIVLAKTPEVLANLQEQFRQHKIKKIYVALVFGHPHPKQGSVNVAIGRHPKRKTPMAVIPFEVTGRGKVRPSQTTYRVIESLKDSSLVEVTIHTGRTHQIRLHMKYLGHPILGDDTYGTKPSRGLSKTLGVARQMLHAKILGFSHPKAGEWSEFEASLPNDFIKIIDRLKSKR